MYYVVQKSNLKNYTPLIREKKWHHMLITAQISNIALLEQSAEWTNQILSTEDDIWANHEDSAHEEDAGFH